MARAWCFSEDRGGQVPETRASPHCSGCGCWQGPGWRPSDLVSVPARQILPVPGSRWLTGVVSGGCPYVNRVARVQVFVGCRADDGGREVLDGGQFTRLFAPLLDESG